MAHSVQADGALGLRRHTSSFTPGALEAAVSITSSAMTMATTPYFQAGEKKNGTDANCGGTEGAGGLAPQEVRGAMQNGCGRQDSAGYQDRGKRRVEAVVRVGAVRRGSKRGAVRCQYQRFTEFCVGCFEFYFRKIFAKTPKPEKIEFFWQIFLRLIFADLLLHGSGKRDLVLRFFLFAFVSLIVVSLTKTLETLDSGIAVQTSTDTQRWIGWAHKETQGLWLA